MQEPSKAERRQKLLENKTIIHLSTRTYRKIKNRAQLKNHFQEVIHYIAH